MFTILGVLVLLCGVVRAADTDKAVKDFLDAKKAATGKLDALKDAGLAKVVPGQTLFSLRFPQFPVARLAPEGFSSSNLLAVDGKDKVTLVKNGKELETFATEHLVAKDEVSAKQAAQTWLLLSSELVQDGFYQFQVIDESLKVSKEQDKLVAAGRLMVTKGGNGEISVQLTFDNAGKLTKVDEMAKVRPGPRPICQATKLLDPDPLVRRICEQDLLIMGTAAREYLMEQRARAAPDLQRAIDRIWERIERDER
jgi:hypothetical protein